MKISLVGWLGVGWGGCGAGELGEGWGWRGGGLKAFRCAWTDAACLGTRARVRRRRSSVGEEEEEEECMLFLNHPRL